MDSLSHMPELTAAEASRCGKHHAAPLAESGVVRARLVLLREKWLDALEAITPEQLAKPDYCIDDQRVMWSSHTRDLVEAVKVASEVIGALTIPGAYTGCRTGRGG